MKPTADDLKRAYNRLRELRPAWPDDMTEAMQDPLIRAQIECQARAMRPTQSRPIRGPRVAVPRTPPTLDFKSRAAGEKDDE